jgi:hypothetical protein
VLRPRLFPRSGNTARHPKHRRHWPAELQNKVESTDHLQKNICSRSALTSHLARTVVSSQSLALADTDRLGMAASTAAAPGSVESQSYLQQQKTLEKQQMCGGTQQARDSTLHTRQSRLAPQQLSSSRPQAAPRLDNHSISTRFLHPWRMSLLSGLESILTQSLCPGRLLLCSTTALPQGSRQVSTCTCVLLPRPRAPASRSKHRFCRKGCLRWHSCGQGGQVLDTEKTVQQTTGQHTYVGISNCDVLSNRPLRAEFAAASKVGCAPSNRPLLSQLHTHTLTSFGE